MYFCQTRYVLMCLRIRKANPNILNMTYHTYCWLNHIFKVYNCLQQWIFIKFNDPFLMFNVSTNALFKELVYEILKQEERFIFISYAMIRSNYILYIALLKYVNCLGILFFQIIKIDSCNIFVWCMLWFFHVSFMYDVNDCLVYGEHAYALFMLKITCSISYWSQGYYEWSLVFCCMDKLFSQCISTVTRNQTTTACYSCANAHLLVTALFSMQE